MANQRDDKEITRVKLNGNNEASHMVELLVNLGVPAEEIKEAIEDLKRAAVSAATIHLSRRKADD
jgi:Holliday junction resolvasome RuvABC DNA-binding subunit